MSINSISSSWLPQIASNSIPKSQQGSFEINSKEFGPVAATAIGVTQAAEEAAGTVCSISSSGLHKLGALAEDGVELLEDAAQAVYSPVAKAARTIGHGLSEAGSAVADAAGSVAGYATLGLAAGKQLISEVV